MDQIQRDGVWWTRDLVGGWLRFNPVTSEWEPSMSSPPPPPPPPPGYVAPAAPAEIPDVPSDFPYDSSIYVPLPKKSRGDELRAMLRRFDPRLAIAGVAVFALLLFGAVGWMILGGNDTAPVAAVSLSNKKLTPKQRFIQQADGLCSDLMTKMNKLGTPTTMAEVTEGFARMKDIIRDAIRRGHAIKAPKKARAGWKRFVGTREQLTVFDELVDAMLSGDVMTAQRLEAEINERAAAERRWAKRYGLKVCSQELG